MNIGATAHNLQLFPGQTFVGNKLVGVDQLYRVSLEETTLSN